MITAICIWKITALQLQRKACSSVSLMYDPSMKVTLDPLKIGFDSREFSSADIRT
jgi:hypothetical protein